MVQIGKNSNWLAQGKTSDTWHGLRFDFFDKKKAGVYTLSPNTSKGNKKAKIIVMK